MNLTSSSLLSRVIRRNLGNGVRGTGVINPTLPSLPPPPRKLSNMLRLSGQQEEEGGPLQWLFNVGGTLLGFVGKIAGAIGFSLSSAFGWLVARWEQISTFNWNATDAELLALCQSMNAQLGAIWGTVVGQGIGWLAGLAVGYGIGFICPVIGGGVLAKAISSGVGSEAISELMPTLRNAITQTIGVMANQTTINAYMNLRQLIKSAPFGLLSSVFGEEKARWIRDKWGGEGEPDLRYSSQVEEAVENITGEVLRAFIENLLDEAWDSFVEAGFVVAQEIDSAFQQNKLSQNRMLGPEKSVVIEPSRDAEEEKIKLPNLPQKILIPTAISAVNTYRQLWNRDVGAIVGEPYFERVKAQFMFRKLTVEFNSRPAPPWRNLDGTVSKRAFYSIPDCKTGLTWQEIKNACDPYTWGKYCARATLNNGRQMVVYGSTAEGAENKLQKLLLLSTAEVLKMNVSSEEIGPERMRKHPTQMYPAHFTLLARTASTDETGRVRLDNRVFDEEIIRIPLWVDTEPSNIPPIL